MKKNMKYGISGLDYVLLKNVPVKKTKHGYVIDLEMGYVEKRVAIELIRQRVPLRGIEVKFLRKVLKLSMAHFGALLGISGTAVMKWEAKRHERLDMINEVAVRSLLADELKVKIDGKISVLRGTKEMPDELRLEIMAA